MRFLHPLAFSLAVALTAAVLPACQVPAGAPAQESIPAEYFSPNNPELQKLHKAKVNPAITSDIVKQRVQERIPNGTLKDVQIEMKTAQWVEDNTEAQVLTRFTPDSEVWFVRITGDIPAPDAEVQIRYKSGSFVVDPELGQILYMTLTEPVLPEQGAQQ